MPNFSFSFFWRSILAACSSRTAFRSDSLSDAATGIGKNCQKRAVANADGYGDGLLRTFLPFSGDSGGRGVEQAPAIVWRQAYRLAVTRNFRSRDEIRVGRVQPDIAVRLEVGEEGPQHGELAAYGMVGQGAIAVLGFLALSHQLIAPVGDLVRAHGGEQLGTVGGDAAKGKELVQVALVVFPRGDGS
jgi:hypothetical protein